MKTRRYFRRIVTITFITILIGGCVDYLTNLEKTLGLDLLFKVRGLRPPPSEVVIVAMDEASEAALGVGQDLTRWRGFHAKLINQLQRQGAALVLFDLQFMASEPAIDPVLAKAMHAAGNVLVTECVQKLRRGDQDFYGREECSESNKLPFVNKQGGAQPLSEQVVAMRKLLPTPLLAVAALDHAPFYLDNDVENATIRASWIFLGSLAETPTLPVLAWFYTLQKGGALPPIAAVEAPLSNWLTLQRRQCLAKLATLPNSASQNRIDAILCGESSRYLDFYGPPQTFRMESYSDVYTGKVADLHDKVVFVGKANRQYSPGKSDFFQTPFTNTKSGKMAGVEIMATHFANLQEGRLITQPFSPGLSLLLYGLSLSLIVTQLSGLRALAVSLLASILYAVVAAWLFKHKGIWLPVASLLIQWPLAVLLSLLWSRRDLLAERKRILAFVRQVFPQWIRFVPSTPGQWHPSNNLAELTLERDISGLCIATDIEGYTSLAARCTAHQMWALLNEYYQILGQSVHKQSGIIADITGDAMMAVWIDMPLEAQRSSACLAALEIARAVGRFNESSKAGRLPTRIGIHEGDMTLGRLDAGEGSHYRAIGDTVNTASRIQGVNKFLGTQILASKAIIVNQTSIVSRPVGRFLLVGREVPVELYELIGLESEVDAAQRTMHAKFAQGLQAFQQGEWLEAVDCFKRLLDHSTDGPARFYLELAHTFLIKPPLTWDGIVALTEK